MLRGNVVNYLHLLYTLYLQLLNLTDFHRMSCVENLVSIIKHRFSPEL